MSISWMQPRPILRVAEDTYVMTSKIRNFGPNTVGGEAISMIQFDNGSIMGSDRTVQELHDDLFDLHDEEEVDD